MQQTITPIDNTIYIEREYNSDKIETTINNSTKAQISWYNLSVKERVVLLKICRRFIIQRKYNI